MNAYRFRICFRNRTGMAKDVAEVAAGLGADITFLHIEPGVMYLRLEYISNPALTVFRQRVKAKPGVSSVEPVERLPQELSGQRFYAIFDNVEAGILVIDQRGIINMGNQKAKEMLGRADSLVGKSLSDVGFPQDLAPAPDTDASERETVLPTPSGLMRFLIKNRPIYDEEGNLDGSMLTMERLSRARRQPGPPVQPEMVTFNRIVHVGAKMADMVSLAKTVALGDSTILIWGESGTGKELFARAIHMASPRRDNPFVVINCAAIPDTLLESELFGYAEGTFTGGHKGGRQGLFEYAHTGTIFLDEVAEIPPHTQAKLLRVLQSGCVRRLGEMLETEVDVRVIAATNRNLKEMVAAGGFREDLFYRLNVIPLQLPPLRRHKEDVPVLVRHFVSKYSERLQKRISIISPKAWERLLAYDWPGNVRELENIIERAVNLAQDEKLTLAHLQLPAVGEGEKGPLELKRTVEAIEKQALVEALKEGQSIRKAAKLLGVSHPTVINKMRRYHLDKKALS
jgi:PAS domain S-box-containing protein